MRLRFPGIAALLVAGASCGDGVVAPAPLGFPIALSTSAISLSQDADIGVTLTNSSDRDVYGAVTGTFIIFERRAGSRWVDQSDWFVTDGIGKSWALKPGEELSERLPIGYIDEPGEYRFQYRLYSDPELTRPLHLSDRVSKSFIVTP